MAEIVAAVVVSHTTASTKVVFMQSKYPLVTQTSERHTEIRYKNLSLFNSKIQSSFIGGSWFREYDPKKYTSEASSDSGCELSQHQMCSCGLEACTCSCHDACSCSCHDSLSEVDYTPVCWHRVFSCLQRPLEPPDASYFRPIYIQGSSPSLTLIARKLFPSSHKSAATCTHEHAAGCDTGTPHARPCSLLALGPAVNPRCNHSAAAHTHAACAHAWARVVC